MGKTMLEGDHPRGPGNQRDEIEMFLRDAFAAGCEAVWTRSLFVAHQYAEREAPKLRAILATQMVNRLPADEGQIVERLLDDAAFIRKHFNDSALESAHNLDAAAKLIATQRDTIAKWEALATAQAAQPKSDGERDVIDIARAMVEDAIQYSMGEFGAMEAEPKRPADNGLAWDTYAWRLKQAVEKLPPQPSSTEGEAAT